MQIACRKCPACLHNRQKEWAFRLMMEAKYSAHPSYFVTLTFDDSLVLDSSLPVELNKKYFHDFIKRFSKRLEYNGIVDDFRYFGCGEYGALGRAHYHFIMFDCPLNRDDLLVLLFDSWKVGFITCEPISDARCMYVAKYTCKELFEDQFYSDKVQKPFASMTRGDRTNKGRSLGYKFLEDKSIVKRLKDEQLFFVRSSNGSSFNLPRYYRDRVFTKYERELRSDFLSLQRDIPCYPRQLYKEKMLDLFHQNLFYESQFFKRLSDARKQLTQIEPYGK